MVTWSHGRRYVGWMLVPLFVVCGGCFSTALRVGKALGKRVAASTATSKTDPALLVEVPAKRPEELAAVESGPGIVVCEPLAGGGVAGNETAFGAGCSRWLQLAVAADEEAGKTPLWTDIDSARRDMHRSDLRLTPTEARQLARHLGVTHAAVGEIRGSGSRRLLSYRVISLADGKQCGGPFGARGSWDEIAHTLPAIAAAISKQAGVKQYQGPGRTKVRGGDLAFIGSLPWSPGPTISARQIERLNEIGVRTSLSDLLLIVLCGAAERPEPIRELAKGISGTGNPMILAELGRQSLSCDAGVAQRSMADLQHALTGHPRNLLHLAAVGYGLREQRKYAEANEIAEQLIRCSPGNPHAWMYRVSTFYQHYDAIRDGRPVSELTDAEASACGKIAGQRMVDLKHVMRLDPTGADAWLSASQTAAELSDGEEADRTLQKALSLRPDDPDILGWGLELYHPKWFGDDAKAGDLARRAVKIAARMKNRWSPTQRVELAREAYLVGYPDEARRIVHDQQERDALERRVQACRDQLVTR